MAKRQTEQFMGAGSYKDLAEIEQVIKDVGLLLDNLKYHAKKNKWRYKISVVISEHDRYIHEKVKIVDGVGRPRSEFRQRVKVANNKDWEYEINPHIHILIKANPGYTVVNYIKKYWEDRFGTMNFYKTNSDTETSEYGNNNYANFKDYAIPQATSIRNDSYGRIGNFI